MKQLRDIFEGVFDQSNDKLEKIAIWQNPWFESNWVNSMLDSEQNSDNYNISYDNGTFLMDIKKYGNGSWVGISLTDPGKLKEFFSDIKQTIFNGKIAFRLKNDILTPDYLGGEISAMEPQFVCRGVDNVTINVLNDKKYENTIHFTPFYDKSISLNNCTCNNASAIYILCETTPIIQNCSIPDTTELYISSNTDPEKTWIPEIFELPNRDIIITRSGKPFKLIASQYNFEFLIDNFAKKKLFTKPGNTIVNLKIDNIDSLLNIMNIDIKNTNKLNKIVIIFRKAMNSKIVIYKNGNSKKLTCCDPESNGWNIEFEKIK